MTASLPGFAVAWRSGITSIQSMRALRPAAKTGIVVGGFLTALAAAWATMNLRQTLNAADPVQGMQAFGDLILGVAVFSVLASIPVGLGLYWLRPVTWFWNILLIVAFTCSATGPAALLISWPLRAALGNWALLGDVRFSLLPVTSLAWATCMLFAPVTRLRWMFLGAAVFDGGLFAAVIFAKFTLR